MLHFAKLFLLEWIAQLTWLFTSLIWVISSTCLSTGGTVVVQIEFKQKCLHFKSWGLLVLDLWEDILAVQRKPG